MLEELKVLYEQDQEDRCEMKRRLGPRQFGFIGSFAQEVVDRDRARLHRVRELIDAGSLTDGIDFFHAALIYQHSNNPEHHAMAHLLSLQAHALGYKGEEDGPDPLWLAAAARDRWQVNMGLPQDFGTQYTQEAEDGKLEQHPVNPDITDEERAKWHVPPLK